MKAVYTLKEDGFSAYWFEGSEHKEKAIIWMHGSAMNEKHCLADSLYLSEAGYSVLVLGFYYWKGMSKKMRAIPVEYVERAASELKKNGYEKIGIHGISSGAAYALLCASLIPDISLALGICPFDYVVEEPKIIGNSIRINAIKTASIIPVTISNPFFLINKTIINNTIITIDIIVNTRSNTVHTSVVITFDAFPESLSYIPLQRLSVDAATFKLVRTHTPIFLSLENTILEE